MYPFVYYRPSSIREAAALARKHAGAKLLAGGQTLLPVLRLRLARAEAMIDLGNLPELRGITAVGAQVVVGAAARHAEVAEADAVRTSLPVLAQVAAGIGDRQVRNMGTLGGSIANNDPAADYPAAVLGLGATVSTNKRDIPADKFFVGMYETALKPAEIITAVAFPMVKRAAYVKFRNPASRYALVGVFVSEIAGKVRVAVTGAGAGVFRVQAMEKALASDFSPAAIASIKVPADGLGSDLHAGAEYRSHLITVLAQRAVAAARSGGS